MVKTKSPWAIAWHCLHDLTFSCFGTVPGCDGQTDGHTTGYNALAQR